MIQVQAEEMEAAVERNPKLIRSMIDLTCKFFFHNVHKEVGIERG